MTSVPSHSAIFCGLSLLFLTGLAINISRIRLRHRIFLGHGDVAALQIAVRTHGNAFEHLTPMLLLLVIYELLGARKLLVDIFGAVILIARFTHAAAYLAHWSSLRRVGVALTYSVEAVLGATVIAQAMR